MGLMVRHGLELRSSAAHPECMILLKSIPGQQYLLALSPKLLWGHRGLGPSWLWPISDELLLNGKSRTCSAGLMVFKLPLLLLLELYASDRDGGGCRFCCALLLRLWCLLGFNCTAVAPVQSVEKQASLSGLRLAAAPALLPTPMPQLITESWCGVGWKGP